MKYTATLLLAAFPLLAQPDRLVNGGPFEPVLLNQAGHRLLPDVQDLGRFHEWRDPSPSYQLEPIMPSIHFQRRLLELRGACFRVEPVRFRWCVRELSRRVN